MQVAHNCNDANRGELALIKIFFDICPVISWEMPCGDDKVPRNLLLKQNIVNGLGSISFDYWHSDFFFLVW